MCTVTFIPIPGERGNKIYLTSNRDEKHWRSSAIPPAVYASDSGKLLYPKDGDAGGTWIAAHENGQAIVFLNGGFVRHTPQPPYRKSRGLILLELINTNDPFGYFQTLSLQEIEPFTAIIWSEEHLYECRWDGMQKHYARLNASQPHIWSSVTLYDEAVIQKRANWFSAWLHKHKQPSGKDILHFHQFTGDGDAHNDLRMNRNGQVFTVSVTLLEMGDDNMHMHYLDLKNNDAFTSNLTVEKSMAGR